MVLKFYIDAQHNCSVRSMHGKVVLENFKASMRHVWDQPEYSIEQNHIIDLRDCELVLSGADLEAISEFMTKNQSVHDRKVALVVSNAMQAGIGAAYSDRTRRKHMSDIFVDMHKAIDYTLAPVNIFDKLSCDKVQVKEF